MTVSVVSFDRIRKQDGFPQPIRVGLALRWRDTDIKAWMEAL